MGVQVPVEAWTTTNDNFALALVGRTLAKRAVYLDSFKLLMANSWGLMYGMEIKKISNERLLFQFNRDLDKKRVLAHGPWSFEKNLVVLAPIEDGEDPSTIPLNHAAFNFQIRGIPISMMHEAMATVIGNGIGEFIELPKNSDSSTGEMHMRLRVQMDITKPIKRALRV